MALWLHVPNISVSPRFEDFYPVLKKLKDEVKANAAAIYCELGGGAHGHLGLVSNPTEYGIVSTVPYVRYTQPKRPQITAAMVEHTVQKKLDEYKEKREQFKEMISLEKVLLTLISHAVPEMYLKPYRNQHSNAIDWEIWEIIDDLMEMYGTVPEEHLRTAESILRAKVFDISKPLVIIYNEMEDLKQIADAAQLPYTDAQFVNLGICLIKNTNDFDKGLTEWFDLPLGQTYITFKKHFTKAQTALRRV